MICRESWFNASNVLLCNYDTIESELISSGPRTGDVVVHVNADSSFSNRILRWLPSPIPETIVSLLETPGTIKFHEYDDDHRVLHVSQPDFSAIESPLTLRNTLAKFYKNVLLAFYKINGLENGATLRFSPLLPSSSEYDGDVAHMNALALCRAIRGLSRRQLLPLEMKIRCLSMHVPDADFLLFGKAWAKKWPDVSSEILMFYFRYKKLIILIPCSFQTEKITSSV